MNNRTMLIAGGIGLAVVAVVLLTRKPAAPVAPPAPEAPPVASGAKPGTGERIAGYAALAAGLITTGIGLYGQGQNAGLF